LRIGLLIDANEAANFGGAERSTDCDTTVLQCK
jgi:hypothetical protein